MNLERLTISNFRVFQGEHTFDLAPRFKDNKKRPIVLFGGLNGAGKTTTLTAVRLALYGKQSLGLNISTKEYSDYLVKSIHRSKHSIIQPNSATVELSFSYSTMGVLKQYVVKRSWELKGRGVKEALSISEDGEPLDDLNTEQCQGFLNELIPIGVSDLFFFDGEKIAELAEDTKGAALGDSIKKLVGLDLIDTLDADLGSLLRGEAKKGGSKQWQQLIEELEKELQTLENQARDELSFFEQAKPQEIEAKNTIEKLEIQLSSKGGVWAATRENAIRKQTALSEEKRLLEVHLREIIGSSFPLALASDFTARTVEQLKRESDNKHQVHIAAVVTEKVESLNNKLPTLLTAKDVKCIEAAITVEFSELTKPALDTTVIHDVSDSLLGQIQSVIEGAIQQQLKKASSLSRRLSEINDQLDRAGNHIARAPEEIQIKPLLQQISKTHDARAASRNKQKLHLENHKRFLREAMGIARQLEKETARLLSDTEKTRTVRYATNAKALLRNFASEMAKRKVKDLEKEFFLSFRRLSHKDDIDLHASIDPTSFSVTLHRPDGIEVDKDELSAGEKQIYAISILEALARTSGRHLPIIIDTPLGRLDSVHRTKLIKNYFPSASHQVIILSTDTEVDEAFYADLSPSISHAFKLDYSSEEGSTTATEGYFWRQERTQAKAS